MLIPFEGTYIILQRVLHAQKSHKIVEIKVFLHFLLVGGRIRIQSRIRANKLRIRLRIQEAQKHTDPEHCH
jgi:hypothetical protein